MRPGCAPGARRGVRDGQLGPCIALAADVRGIHRHHVGVLVLAGVPAVSVPSGLSNEGMPIGLQLVGNFWTEDVLLNLASVYETAFPLHAKPAVFA